MNINELLKNIAKRINYKKIIFDLYNDAISPEIDKLVASSNPKWDDNLKAAFDLIINTLIKPE